MTLGEFWALVKIAFRSWLLYFLSSLLNNGATQFCFPTLEKKSDFRWPWDWKKKLKEEFWGLVKPSEKRYRILVLILLPCICVDDTLLACRVRLCALFGASLTGVQTWECLCLRGLPVWTLPGVVYKHGRLAWSTKSFQWQEEEALPIQISGQVIPILPSASRRAARAQQEVARDVCLNPSRVTGLSSCPVG